MGVARAALLAVAAAGGPAGCAAAAAPPPPPPLAEEAPPRPDREDDVTVLFSVHAAAPRFRGNMDLDGFEAEPETVPRGQGGGIAGEIRPRGWFLSVEYAWAFYSNDLGLEEAHPDFADEDADHSLRTVEVIGGPCLWDFPSGGGRSDGLLGGGPSSGPRPEGPSAFRLDSFVGVRGFHHGIDNDLAPDVSGGIADEYWADPLVGLRVEALVLPGVSLHARGDAGGFGVSSRREWRATAAVGLDLGRGVWLSGGWSALSVDHERGDEGDYSLHALLTGPFLSLEFWF